MYSACWRRRLRRRPSPTRSTFSSEPSCSTTRLRVAGQLRASRSRQSEDSERARLDLPETAVQPARPDDVRVAQPAPPLLQLGHAPERALAVDAEGPPALVDHELELVARSL